MLKSRLVGTSTTLYSAILSLLRRAAGPFAESCRCIFYAFNFSLVDTLDSLSKERNRANRRRRDPHPPDRHWSDPHRRDQRQLDRLLAIESGAGRLAGNLRSAGRRMQDSLVRNRCCADQQSLGWHVGGPLFSAEYPAATRLGHPLQLVTLCRH